MTERLTTRAYMSVFDDAKNRSIVVDALRQGMSMSSACALIGISRQAMHNYRRTDPAFHEACVKAVASYEAGLLAVVNEGCADDAKLALEVLSRRFPSKWSTRTEMRVMDSEDDDERDDARDMSDEELAVIARGGQR